MRLIRRFIRWRRREFWAQSQATGTLHNAWSYLYGSYWSKASSRERGWIIADTQEALDILHRLSSESLERSLEL